MNVPQLTKARKNVEQKDIEELLKEGGAATAGEAIGE